MKARVAILIVSLAVAVFAHETSYGSPTGPRKFDEFGTVGHCDLGARLDNFAIQLQNEPQTVGHIVAYAPEGAGAGSGKFILNLIKDYLLNTRGLPKRRVNIIYAGRNQSLVEPKIELWIQPRGGFVPDPPRFETNIETFKGRLVEQETEDYIELLWDEEMGPGIGLSIDAAFADVLQQQKKAVPYIIVYNGETAVPGTARRLAARQLERLKNHKVDVSRIKTIFGGVRKKSTLELWLTAPGDPPPAKDAGDEQPPLKNIEITLQGDVTLRVPENERAVFNRMLDVLRDQPTLKAVVIVSLEGKQPEPEPEPAATPGTTSTPQPPEPAEPVAAEVDDDPPADLPRMVQKWRDELVNTHKIHPDRFIVLFATARESSGSYLQIWAMPPGQPLPQPDTDEEEEKTPPKKP
jgi:hypothetical protein